MKNKGPNGGGVLPGFGGGKGWLAVALVGSTLGVVLSPRVCAIVTLVTLGCLNSALLFMRGCSEVLMSTPSVSWHVSGSLWMVLMFMENILGSLWPWWWRVECLYRVLPCSFLSTWRTCPELLVHGLRLVSPMYMWGRGC